MCKIFTKPIRMELVIGIVFSVFNVSNIGKDDNARMEYVINLITNWISRVVGINFISCGYSDSAISETITNCE